MKFKGRWTWCPLCQCPRIRCPECGNISCSGGGCDKCHDDFTEAIKMAGDGTEPTKEECLTDTEAIERDNAIVERLNARVPDQEGQQTPESLVRLL